MPCAARLPSPVLAKGGPSCRGERAIDRPAGRPRTAVVTALVGDPRIDTRAHPRHRLHAGERDRDRARRGHGAGRGDRSRRGASSAPRSRRRRASAAGHGPMGHALGDGAVRTYPQERWSEIPAFAGMTRCGIPRLRRDGAALLQAREGPSRSGGGGGRGGLRAAGRAGGGGGGGARPQPLPARDRRFEGAAGGDARGDLRPALQGRGDRRRHRQRRGDRPAQHLSGRGCWR